MKNCPKCRRRYTANGKGQKTEHHIIPRRLFKDRDLPPGAWALLMDFTIELCRGCHDELNRVIDRQEREVLYIEHQTMYRELLMDFLNAEVVPMLKRAV